MAENNNGGIKIDWTKVAIYTAGGLVVYYGVLRPILAKLGIVKSAEQIKNDNEEISITSAWNPNFWKQKPGAKVLTMQWAKDKAYFISTAFGILSDNYNGILGIIKQLNTKSQVSFLADVFQQQYGKDLYSFLRDGGGLLPWDGLSDEHLAQLNKYVNALPNFN